MRRKCKKNCSRHEEHRNLETAASYGSQMSYASTYINKSEYYDPDKTIRIARRSLAENSNWSTNKKLTALASTVYTQLWINWRSRYCDFLFVRQLFARDERTQTIFRQRHFLFVLQFEFSSSVEQIEKFYSGTFIFRSNRFLSVFGEAHWITYSLAQLQVDHECESRFQRLHGKYSYSYNADINLFEFSLLFWVVW